jgi:anion-transporting  ArsA/GET3 family ATPase
MPDSPLAELVDKKRVIVVAGAGGVGKTTTAAALSVLAARRGRRVLCLTIDPAKRLAESLGISEMTSDAKEIARERFAKAGIEIKGSLTVAMLDTKRTFDELVVRYSSTPEKAEKLLANKLYQYVSTSLAGTQEYMAMEKLAAVKADPRYDLIILDTPPTANALDFLDAPERLTEALDSAAMKWFVQAFESSGKFSLNIIAKSAAAVLRGIGKITGGGFLEAMAEFIAELDDLFGGFKERAAIVQKTLRAADVTFVLVASPSPPSIREALFFSERLEEANMPRGGLIVNRFHLPPPHKEGITEDDARAAVVELASNGKALEDDAPERLRTAHHEMWQLAAFDAFHVESLVKTIGNRVPLLKIAALSSDVHDVELLGQIAEAIRDGGVA